MCVLLSSTDVTQTCVDLSGKAFSIPATADNPAVLVFQAAKHVPKAFPYSSTLRIIAKLLFELLEHERTLREGVVFLMNMTDYGWSNFCLDDEKRFIDAFQSRFPLRYNSIFLANSPWWIRSVITMVWPFLKPKMRERLHVVSREEILTRLDACVVPQALGGLAAVDIDCFVSARATTQSDSAAERDALLTTKLEERVDSST